MLNRASIAVFPTNKPSSTESPPGSTTAIPTTPRPTGNSPPTILPSNLRSDTLQYDCIRRLAYEDTRDAHISAAAEDRARRRHPCHHGSRLRAGAAPPTL